MITRRSRRYLYSILVALIVINSAEIVAYADDASSTPAQTTGSLIVITHPVNSSSSHFLAGDFTQTVTGNQATPASFYGNESGVTVTLGAGNYSVSQAIQQGITTSFSADCNGTIAGGETKTCVITNTCDLVAATADTPAPLPSTPTGPTPTPSPSPISTPNPVISSATPSPSPSSSPSPNPSPSPSPSGGGGGGGKYAPPVTQAPVVSSPGQVLAARTGPAPSIPNIPRTGRDEEPLFLINEIILTLLLTATLGYARIKI